MDNSEPTPEPMTFPKVLIPTIVLAITFFIPRWYWVAMDHEQSRRGREQAIVTVSAPQGAPGQPKTNEWVDVSTIIAATAGLWALAFAWVTYAMLVRKQAEDEFLALKSIASGLSVELGMMRGWTGAGGSGYSKNITPGTAPAEWSLPSRQIYKFGYEATRTLSLSPLVYRLGAIVPPFALLSFSVSKLFQFYDDYRSFVNSDPAVWLAPPPQTSALRQRVLMDNFHIHVGLIGGQDSDDPSCLYKAYGGAVSALEKFEASLAKTPFPWWFWIGHLVSAGCFLSGMLLLAKVFWS